MDYVWQHKTLATKAQKIPCQHYLFAPNLIFLPNHCMAATFLLLFLHRKKIDYSRFSISLCFGWPRMQKAITAKLSEVSSSATLHDPINQPIPAKKISCLNIFFISCFRLDHVTPKLFQRKHCVTLTYVV